MNFEDGGGILVESGATLLLSEATVSGNSADDGGGHLELGHRDG